MDIAYAITELQNERSVIDATISRLERIQASESQQPNPGLKKTFAGTKTVGASAHDTGRKPHRKMSEEHRRKISEALRRRAQEKKNS